MKGGEEGKKEEDERPCTSIIPSVNELPGSVVFLPTVKLIAKLILSRRGLVVVL